MTPIAVRAGRACAMSGVESMPRPVAKPAFESPIRKTPRSARKEAIVIPKIGVRAGRREIRGTGGSFGTRQTEVPQDDMPQRH